MCRPLREEPGALRVDQGAVVVVGAGPAGAATALALIEAGVSEVIVLDAGRPPRFRIGETIPAGATDALRRLGVWEAFLAQGHVPSAGSCASWGKSELGYNDSVFDPHGHGWHLDRAAFDALLADTAAARGAILLSGHRLRSVAAAPDGGWTLTAETAGRTPRTARARVLVDASGTGAAALRRLGVARNEVDCLVTLYEVFALDGDGASTSSLTFLEAAAYGWWYAARIPAGGTEASGRLVVALSTDRATLATLRLRDPAVWRAALEGTRHIAPLLAGCRSDTAAGPTPQVAIAASAILSRVVGRSADSLWLGVGDAASSFDPLTAQGITKALSDGWTAGHALAAYLTRGSEVGLADYQASVFDRFNDYLRLRQHLYRREARWPDAPFWRDRPLI